MAHPTHMALITGATGGLGKAFANHLAAEKFNLLLTDMSEDKLIAMARELRTLHGVEVETEAVDLTNAEQLSAFCRSLSESGKVDFLVNCAGFGEGITFIDESVERQMKMIQVHITAAVQLVHAVLPRMVSRLNGKIITVASLAAFIPAPGSSIYAATKAFLNSFMESIHMEVHESGVKVQSLCPGLTHTDFHGRLKQEGKRDEVSSVIPWMEADEVVEISLLALEKGHVVCIPGFMNKTVKKMIPLIPRELFYSMVEKMSRKKK